MSSSTEDVRPTRLSSSARPQRMTCVMLVAAVLGVCSRNYWIYSSSEHQKPVMWLPFLSGNGVAPDQYRIGVKLAAWWMVRHLGWGFRHGFLLMDVVCSLIAVFLLYDLLQRKSVIRSAGNAAQWFASAAFVMLVCFYLAWAQSFEKPETLPSAALAVLMLWLWSPRTTSPPGWSRQLMVGVALLVVTAVEATVRADVACLLSAGIFLGSLAGFGHKLFLSKSVAVVTSGTSAILAAGIQLYLMLHVYPQATYGSTHMFMARYDLLRPLIWVPFILFMIPVFWTAVQFWRQRSSVDGASAGLVLGGGVYLVLWMVMGKLDEVRIFIPFALALAPLTVELAVRRLRDPVASSTGKAEVST